MLPIEGELSVGLRGSLLFHSHFYAIAQATLACYDYSSSVSYATDELVGITETLAKLYLYVANLTILIYIYEALARAGLLHDSNIGHYYVVFSTEVELCTGKHTGAYLLVLGSEGELYGEGVCRGIDGGVLE